MSAESMKRMSDEEARNHTIPGRRAIKYRVACRDITKICEEPLLTAEQLMALSDMLFKAAEQRGAEAEAV